MKTTKNGLPIVNQEQLKNLVMTSDKGILVIGDVGIGKTWVFENSSKFTKDKGFDGIKNSFHSNELVAIYSSAQNGGIDAIKKELRYSLDGRMSIFIDDIGTELEASHFGAKMDIIEWIILELYRQSSKMYFTTNLSLEALTKRYGIRVIDRLKEKCYIVVLEGEGFRSTVYSANLETLANALDNDGNFTQSKPTEKQKIEEDLDLQFVNNLDI